MCEVIDIEKKLDSLLLIKDTYKYDLVINKKYVNRIDAYKLFIVCNVYKTIQIRDMEKETFFTLKEVENGEGSDF